MPPDARGPDEFQAITPQLVVRGAASAIDFYKAAFNAHELFRAPAPDGTSIMHAELLLNGARLLVHDEFPDRGVVGPQSLGGSPVTLHLYVKDVDAAFARAVGAGAAVAMPVQDAFWGERYGIVTDPFGHRWSIATPNDELAPSDVRERASDWAASERRKEKGEDK
jgi:PhnB protein